jgi:hypothetical protein
MVASQATIGIGSEVIVAAAQVLTPGRPIRHLGGWGKGVADAVILI